MRVCMIKYKINVLKALKEKGYNTNYIRKHKIFSEYQLQQTRTDRLVSQDALDRICCLLNCQPGDLLEYVPDDVDRNNSNDSNGSDGV